MNTRKTISLVLFLFPILLQAQEVNILLKEASNLEKQLNEPDALKKYMQVTDIASNNITALVKCTEINCSMGARQRDINAKASYYNTALSYAQKALLSDSTSADANYAMALAAGKMTEVAEKNEQIVNWVKQTKIYANKAFAANPNNAKINYVQGKWHFEMLTLPVMKKAAMKVFYGGLPKGNQDSAIFYMEKCRSLDPYFVRNYLDLAKLYANNQQLQQELDVLNKLVKLPNRTPDDAAMKEEGRKMLDALH